MSYDTLVKQKSLQGDTNLILIFLPIMYVSKEKLCGQQMCTPSQYSEKWRKFDYCYPE